MAGLIACDAKAIARGSGVDVTYVTKAEGKFSAAGQKAEAKGGCVTTGEAAGAITGGGWPNVRGSARRRWRTPSAGSRAGARSNEDRVSPPTAAAFNLVMLATTGAGDSYPFSDLDRMFHNAGFERTELHDLPPSPERIVIAYR